MDKSDLETSHYEIQKEEAQKIKKFETIVKIAHKPTKFGICYK